MHNNKKLILDYLTTYAGKEFKTTQLANRFRLANATTRAWLEMLAAEGLIVCDRRGAVLFWLMELAEEDKPKDAQKRAYEFKPLDSAYVKAMQRVQQIIKDRELV